MPKKLNLVGQKFGRLTPVSSYLASPNTMWVCKCVCGAVTDVYLSSLRSGKTQSCGCLHKEIIAERNRKYTTIPDSTSRTYNIWRGMRSRCRNPRLRSYRWYGALGIEVCPRWESFANFYADMGEAPTGLTIDREDPEGNYEPGNCRWVTREQQRATQRHKGTVT